MAAVNKSLRNTIVREMVSNTLMHREFTSSYTAKFVIEKDRMYVENANRATKEGFITVDNLEPNPKNPIIAAFFRNIGYADQLGSGVRKLFKYCKFYSGKEPEFVEGDVFRITVPLDDEYSFDYGSITGNRSAIEKNDNIKNVEKVPIETEKVPIEVEKVPIETEKVPIETGKVPIVNLSTQQRAIFQFVKENGKITSSQVETLLEVKQRRARSILSGMVELGILERQGSYRRTIYVLKDEFRNRELEFGMKSR